MAKNREFEVGDAYDESLSIGGPDAIKDTLESISDNVSNESYIKNLSPKEIKEKQAELSTVCILINDIEIEKKEAMDEFKAQLKDPNMDKSALLSSIKLKAEERKGNLYSIADQINGFIYIFDVEGVCVESRQLKPTERQLSINSDLKTGTDD